MFLVNALLFLITLPFRLIGTVIGGTLHILGRFITLVNNFLGVVLRAIGIILILFAAVGALFCAYNFQGMGEQMPNWWIYALTLFGIGMVLSFFAVFGEWLGEHLADWGDDLFRFSWQMIIL